jgi:hypothetical protein
MNEKTVYSAASGRGCISRHICVVIFQTKYIGNGLMSRDCKNAGMKFLPSIFGNAENDVEVPLPVCFSVRVVSYNS